MFSLESWRLLLKCEKSPSWIPKLKYLDFNLILKNSTVCLVTKNSPWFGSGSSALWKPGFQNIPHYLEESATLPEGSSLHIKLRIVGHQVFPEEKICSICSGSTLALRCWLYFVIYPYFLTVLWNRNYFLRFRFRLLKSFGSGSGSDFWKSYGSGSSSYFRKVPVPVPVPVPAPYLDHKRQIFQKNFWNIFCLFT